MKQELGALQTILKNKQIKAHYMILSVEKQNYFIVLIAFSEIGALVAPWLKEKKKISWSVQKLKSENSAENLPITEREMT